MKSSDSVDREFLKGTYFEVKGGNVTLILNSILNRYPTKSVLWVLVRVLRNMRQVGIIEVAEPLAGTPNPDSLSAMYRIAKECFFTPKWDVRMDFRIDSSTRKNKNPRGLNTTNRSNSEAGVSTRACPSLGE